MTIEFKLFMITLFLYFSSKAYGIFVFDKLKIKKGSSLGIGYLTNLAFFFILELPVMLFKLSSSWMLIMGGIYFLVSFYIIYYGSREKRLFKFDKKEILALILTFGMMILYRYLLDFGQIETFDNYFYSVFSNGSKYVDNVSTFNPYNGLSNLQNYYKYISYYYQAMVLSAIGFVGQPYLVLSWSFTFMNYFFIMITALTVARISLNKYLNNILSLFIMTLVLSVFRAPFNALHLVTLIIPIYCFTYLFYYFKNGTDETKSNLAVLVICLLASISCSSTTLFVMLPFIYIIYITNCIIKKDENLVNLFFLSVPIILLGFLYLYESLDSLYILLVGCVFVLVIYVFLRKTKWFNDFLMKLGFVLCIVVPIMIFTCQFVPIDKFISKNLMKNDGISTREELDSKSTLSCIGNNKIEYTDKNDIDLSTDIQSTAMEYVYNPNSKKLSTILILLTHSIIKYGGMLFLLLYGVFKLRKKPEFISFVIYLITFYNPILSSSVNAITFGLADRIYLFFNTYFALVGFKYLFEFVEICFSEKSWKKFFDFILKYSWILYGIFVFLSIGVYCFSLKKNDWKRYNPLYKVPNGMIEAADVLNSEIEKWDYEKKKPRIFYTASAFNVSMLEKYPSNSVKVIDTREYMDYFKNNKNVSDKILIYHYFETEGKTSFEDVTKECKYEVIKDKLKNKADCECNIKNLIKNYGLDYIVTKKIKSETLKKEVVDNLNYKIVLENEDITIFKRK